MLHRPDPAGLIAITQLTHAWISGCLAVAWGNETFGAVAPKAEVCLGAEQHDIGWLTWENAPTLNPKTGYPHNFMEVPTADHIDIWSSAKQLALPYGRYVALLLSLHGTGLYERYRGWEHSPNSAAIVKAFFQQEYAFQTQLVNDLRQDPYYAAYAAPEVIQRNRSLVAVWDRMSIALCTGLQQPQQFSQVPLAAGETILTLTPVEDDPELIKVSPWSFQSDQVKLVYEGRRLRSRFTDEAAMQAALMQAEWVTLSTILIPG